MNAMHKIRRVGIEGFRRLRDVSIDMRPMMVMVGANGCGKTSFMDALSLLASSAEGGLNRRLTGYGRCFRDYYPGATTGYVVQR